MRRRVKITGLGPVTPAGIGREAFFRGINEPVSRIRLLSKLEQNDGPFLGAEILNFDLGKFAPEENSRRLSRHTQLGLAAALLAMKDANINQDDFRGRGAVVVTGTSIMDVDKIGRGIEAVMAKGSRYAPASIVYETSVVNVAGKIASKIEEQVKMLTTQTSCCSGLDAVGQAVEMIASGQSDLAIAGGSECPLSYYPMLGFNASELSPATNELPERACRPFDLWRSTGVLGEGACMFILEVEDSPRPALAWIAGYGFANDRDGVAAAGLEEAMQAALSNARKLPSEIDYINAWGPGHRIIDHHEARAIRAVFGSGAQDIPVTSIKGAIGTPLGASGPIQLASTVLTSLHGQQPPTVNWEHPDPACPLNLSGKVRHVGFTTALVNAHGMAGSNTSLVIERA